MADSKMIQALRHRADKHGLKITTDPKTGFLILLDANTTPLPRSCPYDFGTSRRVA